MKLLSKLSAWVFVITASFVIILGIYLKYSPDLSRPKDKIPEINRLRQLNIKSSNIEFEEWLGEGSNYKKYIVSFYSDGLKQFAYLSVPVSPRPKSGFPVIVLNHGYQIPKLYTPEGNYIPHLEEFGAAGFIVFKPDFRGHGKSEGFPGSAYFSEGYTVDVLSAIAAIKNFPDADADNIGLWGHSMGAHLSLRAAEVAKEVKALVVWSGVVSNYNDIIFNWHTKVNYKASAEDLHLRFLGLSELIAANGPPGKNPTFWNTIDPLENLTFLSSPVQIHVGLKDTQVPPQFSKILYKKLQSEGKDVEYFEYPIGNHDIDPGFDLAIKRSLDFFNRKLK